MDYNKLLFGLKVREEALKLMVENGQSDLPQDEWNAAFEDAMTSISNQAIEVANFIEKQLSKKQK